MKRVANPQSVPPSNPPDTNQPGFYYIQSETGMKFEANTVPQLIDKVFQHRRSNGLPVGSFFEQEVEDWYCQKVPERCVDREHPLPSIKDRVVGFVKTMAQWASTGLPLRSKEEYAACIEICTGNEAKNIKRCEYYRGDRGIGLVSCGRCGCSGLKVWAKSVPCPAGKF